MAQVQTRNPVYALPGPRPTGPPVRLLVLIRSLDRGGAQRQLGQLLAALDPARWAVTVITFYDGGALWPEIAAIPGVRVLSVHKRGRWDVLPFLARLWRAVRAARPQIVHGYMGTANELALILGRAAGARVVWGLRASQVDFSHYEWGALAAASARLGAALARFADLIIVNSHAGQAYYRATGYAGAHMRVIPNGIDTARFAPDPAAGRHLRRAWGVADGAPLIGIVARLDDMKDHPTFLRAAARLATGDPAVRFVCVGGGPPAYARNLRALAAELGLGERVIWAGDCDDVPAAYNALDILTSASAYGEGFSNVLGEALACAVPCVATDVGDAARIVGDSGLVVPPGQPEALARAWAQLLARPAADRARLGAAARARIMREYGVPQLAGRTDALLRELLP